MNALTNAQMQSQSTSRTGESSSNAIEESSKPRQRKTYSCRNCRHRKIRCDRTCPCGPCKIRGISASCASDVLFHKYALNKIRRRQSNETYTTTVQDDSSSTQIPENIIDSKRTSVNAPTLEDLRDEIGRLEDRIIQFESRLSPMFGKSPSSSAGKLEIDEFNRLRMESQTSKDGSEVKGSNNLLSDRLDLLDLKMNLILQRLAFINQALLSKEAIIPRQAQATSSALQFDNDDDNDHSSRRSDDLFQDLVISRWLEAEAPLDAEAQTDALTWAQRAMIEETSRRSDSAK